MATPDKKRPPGCWERRTRSARIAPVTLLTALCSSAFFGCQQSLAPEAFPSPPASTVTAAALQTPDAPLGPTQVTAGAGAARPCLHNLRRQRIAHGNAKRKQVAITIDDGPHPDFTPRLLETLARYHVRATFFVVGRMAARYPQLIRAIVAEGHCLGNHTYSHADLHALRDDQVDAEITRCAAVLRDITGQCIHLFRPPYGHYSERTLDRSVALGYTMVLWSVHSRDIGGLSARQIEQGVMRRVKPGSIVLFHDGAPQTLQALPRILARLADRGYQFLTADEMLAQGDNGRSSKSGRRPQSVRGRILSDQS